MQKNVPKGGQPNRVAGMQHRRPVENEKINKIMNNDAEIERTLKRNPSFNKRDRLYEFQADFEKKMEKMNKELQTEIEAEADELRKSELSNQQAEHGLGKQKAPVKASVPMRSITNRDATPSRPVMAVVQEAKKSPDGTKEKTRASVPPLYLKSQNRAERMVYHKV